MKGKRNTSIPCGLERRKLVLLIDPDNAHVSDISNGFRDINVDVMAASCGEEAWNHCINFDPAVVVTEVDLPGMSGFDFCRRLKATRATADTPILFVTSRGQEIDRVVGFELGAADYVTKPVNYRELTLRILRILERSGFRDDRRIRFGRLVIDFEQSIATINGHRLNITPTEFRVLSVLVKAQGRLLTRKEIVDHTWPSDQAVMNRTVDAHVKSLRPKLETTWLRIVTIRSVGYSVRYEPEKIEITKPVRNTPRWNPQTKRSYRDFRGIKEETDV